MYQALDNFIMGGNLMKNNFDDSSQQSSAAGEESATNQLTLQQIFENDK